MLRKISLLTVLVLLLSSALMVSAQTEDSPTPIAIGDSITASLTDEQPDMFFSFEATAGDNLLIDLTASFDTYLYLLDANGRELERNDDGGEGLDSRILGYEVPADGTYIIRATSFSFNSSGTPSAGSFDLSLSILETSPLESGMVLTGTAEGLIGLYEFSGDEGTVIAATLSAGGFDTELTLTGPSGFQVAFGRYIDGENTAIGPYTLEETGTYLLSASGSGDYTLTFDVVEPEAVMLGTTVNASFIEGKQTLYFSVEGSRNDVVDVIVDSGSTLDTVLTVISPFGFEVARVEDSSGSVDPQLLGTVLPDDGVYIIVINAQNPNAVLVGDVAVTVAEAQLASLEDGAALLEFDDNTEEQILTFEGTMGETVRITVEVTSGPDWISPYIQLSDDQGSSFANFSMNGLTRISADVPIETTGTVSVRFQVYSDASLTVSFERLAE